MAFKMKGSPAKLGTINGTAGHASALKHTRRREGHMDKYGNHTNADHPNYWTKDETTGKTPKSVEVEADNKSKSSENNSTSSNSGKSNEGKEVKNEKTPKKRNLLQKIGDKLKEGHKVRKKTDADYKANKKSGESKHQYNVRKRREDMQAAKKAEEAPSKMKGSPAKQKLDGKPSAQEQKLHDELVTGKKSKTKKGAEEFGKNIKKKIKAYKK
mgnify:CR=1 FL=1